MENAQKLRLDLQLKDGRRLFIKTKRFESLREELESFLVSQKHMNTLAFSKKVMFSHELKANNGNVVSAKEKSISIYYI